jgi:hypothetical protein
MFNSNFDEALDNDLREYLREEPEDDEPDIFDLADMAYDQIKHDREKE